ncbi:MAG: Uric acid degradation bifunctional protein PucL [Verrucomicrobiota bacterium]|jgi:2-oxo-4-hydroxy-4-carboxy-5-ureidoimidazoline decarboxylase
MSTSLTALNSSDRDTFTAALGHLFEHSPWVAEETWSRRPFASAEALHAALCTTMRAAPQDRQLALIRAHPDLAGRLAQQKKLTAESTREQASAGLDQLTDAELAAFTRQNDAYKAKFGFPFIICARLNAKSAILDAMQARSTNPPDTEFATALGEIEKIARLRLLDVLGTANQP